MRQDRGIFRPEMSDKIAANCFFGALDEMVTSWVLSENEYQLSNVAEVVVGILPEWYARESTSMNLRTLNDVFFTMLERNADCVMMTREHGAWKTISAIELRNWVYATARQLQAWGIKKGDRVILLSENRPEWAIADLACLLLGIVDVPIYATQTSEQCLFVIQNCEARVAFVSSRKQYEKIAAIREQTGLEYVVIMDDAPELTEAVPMQSFLRSATTENDPALEDIGHQIEPDDLATLIYTSGTTGTRRA